MATASARTAIRSYLDANWSDPAPLAYENEIVPTAEPPAPWVFIEIFGRSFWQASIGSGDPTKELWRDEGTVNAHVMVPLGTGASEASRLAELLVLLLRGVILPSGVRFTGAAVGAGDPGDERGKYWRLTASIEWERDHTNG